EVRGAGDAGHRLDADELAILRCPDDCRSIVRADRDLEPLRLTADGDRCAALAVAHEIAEDVVEVVIAKRGPPWIRKDALDRFGLAGRDLVLGEQPTRAGAH